MDKVIIDEVDVSECKHFGIDNMELCKINFDNNYFSNGIPCAEKCSNHPDCYYKQLKRLEQERNEWKKKYEYAANENLLEIYELIKKNDAWRGIVNVVNGKLEQENEQIKKDYAKLHIDFAKCNEENGRLKARLRPLEDSYFKGLSTIEIAELAKKSIRITAENRKLEYALQEIREYCKEQNLKADYTACEIIDKINSVIGAE